MKEPEMDNADRVNNSTPLRLKRLVMTLGLVLIIIGTPFTINLFCIVPLILFNTGTSDPAAYGVVSLTFALLTLGTGLAAYIHGNHALKNKPSTPIRFPSQPMLMVGLFIFLYFVFVQTTPIVSIWEVREGHHLQVKAQKQALAAAKEAPHV